MQSRFLLTMSMALVVAACGKDAPTDTKNGGTGPTGGSTSSEIAVNDNNFDPNSTTVAPGTTVTWTWVGGGFHNVTFATAGIAGSGNKTSGGTFQNAFPIAGTCNYSCSNHGGMSGTIKVQ